VTGRQQDPAEVQRGVAETLARYQPETWRLLLVHHIAGADGRCRACALSTRGAPKWPCTLYLVAEHARLIVEERAAGLGDVIS
jgi:hypothetical protein